MHPKPADRERITTRNSLIYLLRRCPSLSLTELFWLVETGPPVLSTITVEELRKGAAKPDDEVLQLIQAYFQRYPKAVVPAIFFARLFDVPRWQAQRLANQLVREEVLVRSGKTGNTRYRAPEPAGGDHHA